MVSQHPKQIKVETIIIKGKRSKEERKEILENKAKEIIEKWHQDDINRGILDNDYRITNIGLKSWDRILL